MFRIIAISTLISLLAISSATASTYGRVSGGIAWIDDNDFSQTSGGSTNQAQIASGVGWVLGAAVGNYVNKNVSVEVAWDYRTNEQDSLDLTNLSSNINVGNYESNIFFLNGYYHFGNAGSLRPYLGLGIGWVEEISLDAGNTSYTADNEIAYQFIGGLELPVTKQLAVNAEFRHMFIHDEMNLTGNGTTLQDFEYEPFSGTLGLKYNF